MTRQALEEGLAKRTTRRTRKDGRLVDVELLLVPLVVDGDRTGYLLVYHDVTAAKEAETRFRRLAEELPLVTYVDAPFAADDAVSAARRAEHVHQPAVRIDVSDTRRRTGATTRSGRRIVHPEDRERVLAEQRHFQETGEPLSIEYRMYPQSGRVVWVRDESVIVRDEAALRSTSRASGWTSPSSSGPRRSCARPALRLRPPPRRRAPSWRR